jgi:hypothetical protein
MNSVFKVFDLFELVKCYPQLVFSIVEEEQDVLESLKDMYLRLVDLFIDAQRTLIPTPPDKVYTYGDDGIRLQPALQSDDDIKLAQAFQKLLTSAPKYASGRVVRDQNGDYYSLGKPESTRSSSWLAVNIINNVWLTLSMDQCKVIEDKQIVLFCSACCVMRTVCHKEVLINKLNVHTYECKGCKTQVYLVA